MDEEYDFSFLDDLIPSGGVNPSSFDTSFLDDFDFGKLANSFDFSTILGDQPGDFPLDIDQLKTWDTVLGNDQALLELFGGMGDQPGDFPIDMPTLESWDAILGNKQALDEILGVTGDQPGDFPISGFVGSPTAPGVFDATQDLLKYNTAIAQGGYPVMNKDGTVTVKDKDGKDLFDVDKDKSKVQDVIRNLVGGKGNAELLAALLGGLLGLSKSQGGGAGRVVGYQGGQGKPLTATRQALAPAGAPGSGGGRRFLTDVQYAAEGGLMDEIGYQPNQNVLFMRSGGISDLGSYSDGGRMLKGPGDGMSDDIPATIGGKRPARLADGEFVVPADVVSHLGNGSTDAGADVLYDMMDKVRKARTGTKQQGKQINPKKYVPS